MSDLITQSNNPIGPDEILDLGYRYATEGLSEDADKRLESWFKAASDVERKEFAKQQDLLAEMELATLSIVSVPEIDLNAVIAQKNEGTQERALNSPLGFEYLSKEQGVWRDLPDSGVRIKELSSKVEDGFSVVLLEMDAGSKLKGHHHKGAEHAYLLSGDLSDEGLSFQPGDYIRFAANTDHSELYSKNGCRALLIMANENYPRRGILIYDGIRKLNASLKKMFQRSSAS